ncbi:hypothetical protein QBC38DRAFT_477018 [Podospora fimiseda]|uniref:Alternative oxidase n=1 Tax=Podospora fimiseda TaxID=252190 RepID=A0AAN7BQQ1_9PEZI|nr:hypothetical protein QBC38DRAFT_477018 [Podospora fimiseda]
MVVKGISGHIMGRHNALVVVFSLLFAVASIWTCRVPIMSSCLYKQTTSSADSSRLRVMSVPPSDTLNVRTVDMSKADSPFITWPLQRVCKETQTWTPGLVFICDNNSGGIGNIRTYILVCIRYAIEAGASGLVLPRIMARDTESLSGLFGDYKPFDYMFDEAHFRESLKTACPQISIYSLNKDIPNAPKRLRPVEIHPINFGKRGACDKRELSHHTGRWGKLFWEWLEKTAEEENLVHPPSLQHPRIIRFQWGVQFNWPTWKDGPEFVATYGGLLRFRSDILDIGRKLTQYMREPAGKSGGLNTFIGMHLRTENDALVSWPKYEEQAAAYLERASKLKFKAVYLATGNETEAQRFAQTAEHHGMKVTTKHKLLEEHHEDQKRMSELTWDQQAMIDYVVMTEADYFLGVNPSSFSIGLAMKRHLKEDGLYTRPWKIGSDGDSHSWVIGHYDDYYKNDLYMYESIWP